MYICARLSMRRCLLISVKDWSDDKMRHNAIIIKSQLQHMYLHACVQYLILIHYIPPFLYKTDILNNHTRLIIS